MTEEGISIPTTTELVKSSEDSPLSGMALPVLGSAALVTALAHDYESRLRRGEYVHDPSSPIYKRVYDRLGQMAHDHPAYSVLAGLTMYGLGKGGLGKFGEYLGSITAPTTDSVRAPRVDFDKVAYKVGVLLWP